MLAVEADRKPLTPRQRRRSVAINELLKHYDMLFAQVTALESELKAIRDAQIAAADPERPSAKEHFEKHGRLSLEDDIVAQNVDAICDGLKAGVRSINAVARIDREQIRCTE